MSAKRKSKKAGGSQDSLIALRAVSKLFADHPFKQFSFKQISKKLLARHEKTDVYEAINYLLDNGTIVKSEINRLVLSEKARSRTQKTIEGIIDMTASGNAYLISGDTSGDTFIAAKNLNRAFDGDRVKVAILSRRKSRDEGQVIEILARERSEIVGTYESGRGFGFVVPDKTHVPVDLFIPGAKTHNLRTGERVIARIVEWPERSKNPVGEIVEVLGSVGNNDVEMKTILVENGFPVKFPSAVLEELKTLPEKISDEEINLRRDFRGITTFTIDPDDAKDFDDALSYKQLGNNRWEVGVHIADVSHYVRPKTALDKEAFRRGTSVYMVDRVLPMLPEQVSNILCSLRPKEDKLCFSAVFEMDENAKVHDFWFGKTIIHSDRRFTYDEVQSILETGKGEFVKEISTLNKLATKLREIKFKNGAVGFETVEVKFQIDLEGVPIGVVVKERKEAHLLIEDFMLLANKSVAEKIGKPTKGEHQMPFVFRIHDRPDTEKLLEFSATASTFGYELDVLNRNQLAQNLNRLLEQVKGTPQQNMIEQLAIRSMAKAVYSTGNIGHFGLAFPYYTHFTSPIRRYPDLLVHRLLEKYIETNQTVPNSSELDVQCTHCSWMERKAMNAERESVKYKQVEYMQNKLGMVFDALITGVVHFGLFVEIIENKCEGLVDIDSLIDDYYVHDQKGNKIIGTDSGRVFSLGDTVSVKAIKVNLERRRIDFEII